MPQGVSPTKAQIAKCTRALEKLAVLNPAEALATRVAHAFLAVSVDPRSLSGKRTTAQNSYPEIGDYRPARRFDRAIQIASAADREIARSGKALSPRVRKARGDHEGNFRDPIDPGLDALTIEPPRGYGRD